MINITDLSANSEKRVSKGTGNAIAWRWLKHEHGFGEAASDLLLAVRSRVPTITIGHVISRDRRAPTRLESDLLLTDSRDSVVLRICSGSRT